MRPVLHIPLREFQQTLDQYIASTKRDLREIVNQRALNVAGRAFTRLPPANVDAQRAKIKLYLKEQLSTRFVKATSGKRKGHFIKKGARNNQLQRVHLIIQARRRRAGLPGLYGAEMRKAAGKFKRLAAVSSGFLKSVFLPIITALNPLVPFKFPWRETYNIARWPGSQGYGRASVAFDSLNPIAIIHVGFALSKTENEPRVQELVAAAIAGAVESERIEMADHIRKKLLATAQRYGRAA